MKTIHEQQSHVALQSSSRVSSGPGLLSSGLIRADRLRRGKDLPCPAPALPRGNRGAVSLSEARPSAVRTCPAHLVVARPKK